MKKTLLCSMGLMGLIANAYAGVSVSNGDATLNVNAMIDTGVASVTHTGNGKKTTTGAVDSILGVSNLAFSGDYKLDGDTTAFFNLVAGFNPSTGELSNKDVIFSRNAYFGVKGPYGALSFGRQWTFSDDWLVGNVFKGGYNSGAIFKLSEFDAVSDNYARVLKYTSPVLNNWQFGTAYAFGNHTGSVSKGQIADVAAKYAVDNFMIAGDYEYQKSGSNNNSYQLATIGGHYVTGPLTERLGVSYADISGPGTFQSIASQAKKKSVAVEGGLDYQATPKLTLSGDVTYKENTTASNHTMEYRALAQYQLFKPLSLIANVVYLKNSNGATESLVNTDSPYVGGGYPNQNQLSTAVGVKFVF